MKKNKTKSKILILSTMTAIFLLQGCVSNPSVAKKHKIINKGVCTNLASPPFLSFKQVAFSLAKKEKLDNIGDINDFYFYDKKFKSKWFYNIPDLKIELESKHNVSIGIENYIYSELPLNIIAMNKRDKEWFENAKNNYVSIKKGHYKVADIYNKIREAGKVNIDKSLLNIKIEIKRDLNNVSIFKVLNMTTKDISKNENYEISFYNDILNIAKAKKPLIVNYRFVEPFVEMLNTKGIYYHKTNNTFFVKDNLYNLWYVKEFLKSLNFSDDQFTYCVNIDGKDIYGNFDSNNNVVIKGVGKIQLVDYGYVHNGKLKYKLKIIEDNGAVDEYIIYNLDDTFSVQLNNGDTVKIKLF